MRLSTNDFEQSLLIRVANRVSDPIHLSRKDESAFESDDGSYRAELSVTESDRRLRFDVSVDGPEPIWMIEWTASGFDFKEVVVPALGGQVITDDMPVGESIVFKYPFWWNAQFAIGVSPSGEGGVWLRTTDREPVFKMLRIGRRTGGRFALTLGIEADAPLRRGKLRGTWYLEAFDGDWTVPTDIQQSWMTEAFGLRPFDRHPSWPGWADDIRLVFELWGAHRERVAPAHTFAQMEDRVRSLAPLHPPERTLLYVVGFANSGIDSEIPNYDPSEKLGGRDGFARLVDTAHDLGYRVMIHTNVLGMAYSHPRFAEFSRHQVVDVFGRPQGWAMDLDGDWLAEPYFAYMNPGETAWSDLMTSILGPLIGDFDLDAVFLDQTLLAFNVERGPNFVTGMRRHVEALQVAFPGILFAGEGLNDIVQPALPLAQIHGIDSITGVHGIDSTQSWRRVHPVSARLFGRSTRFTPHLLTKHPAHPLFERQEEAYVKLGIVPALVCYDHTQTLDHPAIRALLDRARTISATP